LGAWAAFVDAGGAETCRARTPPGYATQGATALFLDDGGGRDDYGDGDVEEPGDPVRGDDRLHVRDAGWFLDR
jgi:hypothetical protein